MDTAHCVLSAHAHNLAQNVGKGRQQDRSRCSDIDAAARAGYVLYRAPVIVMVSIDEGFLISISVLWLYIQLFPPF